MKNAKLMFAVVLMVLPGLAAAQLGSSDKIMAKVPFEFVVANKVIPAGQCAVRPVTMNATTLLISNAGANASWFSGAVRGDTKESASSYALVFHKQGSQYFLRGIKLGGSRVAYSLPESKAEAELRAQNVQATEEIVLASLK